MSDLSLPPKLTNDQDRAEWLQCLQAAASYAGQSQSPDLVISIANRLFHEFRKMCGE